MSSTFQNGLAHSSENRRGARRRKVAGTRNSPGEECLQFLAEGPSRGGRQGSGSAGRCLSDPRLSRGLRRRPDARLGGFSTRPQSAPRSQPRRWAPPWGPTSAADPGGPGHALGGRGCGEGAAYLQLGCGSRRGRRRGGGSPGSGPQRRRH